MTQTSMHSNTRITPDSGPGPSLEPGAEPRAEFVDVVVQDEYTHDVIVRISDQLYAVFAATCLGAVLSVAIWDHEPTAEELLARRLQEGWQPTPTATREGKVVLGYAACAVGKSVELVRVTYPRHAANRRGRAYLPSRTTTCSGGTERVRLCPSRRPCDWL